MCLARRTHNARDSKQRTLTMNCADPLIDRFSRYLLGAKGRSDNTARVYTDDIKPFITFIKNEGLDIIGLDRNGIRRYLAWLATAARGSEGGYARTSVARKLVVLRAFYRFLVGEQLIDDNPVTKGQTFHMKSEKRLPVFLNEHETDRLLRMPDPESHYGLRDRAILEVLYSSGLRLSELSSLDLNDVDLTNKELKVWGKGAKERVVLIGKPAVNALRSYLNTARQELLIKPTTALFLNRYGHRLSKRSVEKMVSRCAALAAVRPGVHAHTLRHTFATHMLEGGADLRIVQHLLGHSSPATTQIYTHVTNNQARTMYLKSHPRAKIHEGNSIE